MLQNRQYYLEPYQKEFTTNLKSSTMINDQYHVVLENTIFYPEGGGQPADTGLINDVKVLDVYEQDGIIYHICESEIQSQIVNCRIDWQRRHNHMQYHTGQHILSAIFYRHFNYQTCGFHLGSDYSTIDIDAERLTEEEILKAEQLVNDLIQKNVAITSYFINRDETNKFDLRKQPQTATDIRIVELADFDSVPCCGTHLQNTGEVGLLKIIKAEKNKSLTRIYYHCGMKAFLDYQAKHNMIATIAEAFSTSESEVLNRVTTELNRKRELEQDYIQLQKQLMFYEAQDLISKNETNIIVTALEDHDSFDQAQNLANAILAQGNYLAMISVGQRLLITHNLETGLDCGQIIKEHGSKFGGRGGGGASFGQVYFPTKDQMDLFKNKLKELLN